MISSVCLPEGDAGDEVHVHGIDQCVTGIKEDEAIEGYLERMKKELMAAKVAEFTDGLESVRQTVKNDTGFTLSDKSCLSIQRGLLQGVRNILNAVTSKKLEDLRNQVLRIFSEKGYHEVEEDAIDVGFICRVLEAFQHVLGEQK